MKNPIQWLLEAKKFESPFVDESFNLKIDEFVEAVQKDAIASAQEEVEKMNEYVKRWQYVADTVYERWLDTRAKLDLLKKTSNPEFHYTEIVYATKDLDVLENILKRNNNVISSSLEVALEENLFPTVPALLKTAFIVRECERIISGAPRPKGERLKTFEFRRTPRPDA